MMDKKKCSKCGEIKNVSEFHKNKGKKDGLQYKCKLCSNIQVRDWRSKNYNHARSYEKKWRKNNPEKNRQKKRKWVKKKYRTCTLFRLKVVYRKSCLRAFQSIGQKKNNKSLKLLGLKTWQELTKHLESKFYDHPKTGEKMTLDNHSFYGWHLDHIIPISSAKTEKDIIKLCHYTNLQPLWAKDNLNKGNKILDIQSII